MISRARKWHQSLSRDLGYWAGKRNRLYSCPVWANNDALMSVVKYLVAAKQSRRERHWKIIAHRWGRNLKDVGDQALMRGLATAFPSVRPGLSRSYSGHRR
jgi:hypothetical protein